MNSEFTVGGSTNLDGIKSLFSSAVRFYEYRGKCFRGMGSSFQVGQGEAADTFSNQRFCFGGRIFLDCYKMERKSEGCRETVKAT
jgi:hypothetical protein